MGKRKFDSEKEKSPKKARQSESEGNDGVEEEQPQNEENMDDVDTDGFDVKYFRKELAAKQGQTMALTQFLQVCLNPDSPADYLLQYF